MKAVGQKGSDSIVLSYTDSELPLTRLLNYMCCRRYIGIIMNVEITLPRVWVAYFESRSS